MPPKKPLDAEMDTPAVVDKMPAAEIFKLPSHKDFEKFFASSSDTVGNSRPKISFQIWIASSSFPSSNFFLASLSLSLTFFILLMDLVKSSADLNF